MDDEIKLVERIHCRRWDDSDNSSDEEIYDEDFEDLRLPPIPVHEDPSNIIKIELFEVVLHNNNPFKIIPHDDGPNEPNKKLTENQGEEILPPPHPVVINEDVNGNNTGHNAELKSNTDYDQNLQEKFGPSYADAVKLLRPALQLPPAQQQQPINGMLNLRVFNEFRRVNNVVPRSQ